jgi:glycosyltransferase involved in cell wall biosynthesis
MKISIGILAHNESANIGHTLESLFQQSLFTAPPPDAKIEIVVVPNGCRDDTGEKSRTILAELIDRYSYSHVKYAVCEIAQPGKANAWNQYVHQFSDPTAEYLIFVDADIQFVHPDTIRNTIGILEERTEANVSVDTPTKDILFKKKKNLLEKLSVAVTSAATNNTEVWICGQYYCGRAAVMRQIWIPPGLLAEDGFISYMIRTNNLQSAPVYERIVRAPNAAHIFEALTSPQKLMRHEKRVVIAMTINHFLFEYLEKNCRPPMDAGSFIKEMNDRDPKWLKYLFEDVLSRSGWWIIPSEWLWSRLEDLQYLPFFRAMLLLPAVIVAFFVNWIVFFQANLDMRRGKNIGYW